MAKKAGLSQAILALDLDLNRNTYRKVREHIRESCSHLAELAVGEVLANAIEHGSAPHLVISVRPRRIVVVVTNDLHSAKPRKSKPKDIGGRGIAIVQELAATGAIRRYDCTVSDARHVTRLVLDRDPLTNAANKNPRAPRVQIERRSSSQETATRPANKVPASS